MSCKHIAWLALLAACGPLPPPAERTFEDDFDEDEDSRTPRADRLERYIDADASARVDYDLVYDVYVDGQRRGTGRLWRTPPDDPASGLPIVTGLSFRGTDMAGYEFSVTTSKEYASTEPYALLEAHGENPDESWSLVAANNSYIVRDDDGQRTVPRAKGMNLLEIETPVLRTGELRKGMWMKTTIIDPETAARVSITRVVTRLGWADYGGERVRVLWLTSRGSDGEDSETVILSNGILAVGMSLPGVQVRLRGVVFTR